MVKAAIKVSSSLHYSCPGFLSTVSQFDVLSEEYITEWHLTFAFVICARMAFDVCLFDMQRGVYFEITYSNLISDVQSRKQVISNAKVRIEEFLCHLSNFGLCNLIFIIHIDGLISNIYKFFFFFHNIPSCRQHYMLFK